MWKHWVLSVKTQPLITTQPCWKQIQLAPELRVDADNAAREEREVVLEWVFNPLRLDVNSYTVQVYVSRENDDLRYVRATWWGPAKFPVSRTLSRANTTSRTTATQLPRVVSCPPAKDQENVKAQGSPVELEGKISLAVFLNSEVSKWICVVLLGSSVSRSRPQQAITSLSAWNNDAWFYSRITKNGWGTQAFF